MFFNRILKYRYLLFFENIEVLKHVRKILSEFGRPLF